MGIWKRKYYDIQNSMERGLISGYEDGTIRPQQTITRAAFAKLMVTAEF